jgi:hypothetical protein
MFQIIAICAIIFTVYRLLAWVFSVNATRKNKKERLSWYLVFVQMPASDYKIFMRHPNHSVLAGHAISQEIKPTRDSLDRYSAPKHGKQGRQNPPRHGGQPMDFND